MNLKRTVAFFAQQSFFFWGGTIWNALRFALRIISGNKVYISRLPRSAERGNRIFTGRAVTADGLLSNNVCKGYCKNWIAFIQPEMRTLAENTGKWQKCCTQPCILL